MLKFKGYVSVRAQVSDVQPRNLSVLIIINIYGGIE